MQLSVVRGDANTLTKTLDTDQPNLVSNIYIEKKTSLQTILRRFLNGTKVLPWSELSYLSWNIEQAISESHEVILYLHPWLECSFVRLLC